MDGLPPPAGQPVETSAPADNKGRGILIVVSALAVLAIVGYAVSGNDDSDNINPAVRERIAELEADRDCGELQDQFDIADRNGNTDVLELVDAAMSDAGCYD